MTQTIKAVKTQACGTTCAVKFHGRPPIAKQPHLSSLSIKYCLHSSFIAMSYGDSTP